MLNVTTNTTERGPENGKGGDVRMMMMMMITIMILIT